FVSATALLLLFVLWNAGLIFQWGAHLIPPRGPISFSEVAHNQIFVVPRQISADLRRYFFKRKDLMQRIEQRDIQELEKNPPPPRSLGLPRAPLLLRLARRESALQTDHCWRRLGRSPATPQHGRVHHFLRPPRQAAL